MNNIFRISLLALFAVFCHVASAQDLQEKEEKIEALKIAYISKRLALTPKEAEVFWPVYNQYMGELQRLRKERKERYVQAKDRIDQMPEKELNEFLAAELSFQNREAALMQVYQQELRKVLPLTKVAKLYVAEETFKRQLLKRLKEQK